VKENGIESYAAGHLRVFFAMTVAVLIFVGIIAVAVFFIFVKGAEQTLVPDVRQTELVNAILELQVKELYPRLQLRQSSAPRGIVLEQDPEAGTIVKAGRRIRLVVSQGMILSKVENYLGRNIEEVRMDIQAVNAGTGAGEAPLLILKEPFLYEYSKEAPGTILEQQPEPGADISGPTALRFVVSQSQEEPLIAVPLFTGLSLEDALAKISRENIDFTFKVTEPLIGEIGETVIAQEPEAGEMVRASPRLTLTLTAPQTVPDGEVFGVFRHAMPENPYPLRIRLEAQLPGGGSRQILETEYPGGDLAVPYRVPEDTVLVLTMLDREIYRETVN